MSIKKILLEKFYAGGKKNIGKLVTDDPSDIARFIHDTFREWETDDQPPFAPFDRKTREEVEQVLVKSAASAQAPCWFRANLILIRDQLKDYFPLDQADSIYRKLVESVQKEAIKELEATVKIFKSEKKFHRVLLIRLFKKTYFAEFENPTK
ncbi:hypothetical protein K9N08_00205 [Candidatus Gracilibacteria bacterium]|nr:hypothetical protein [Candidatus Gracilibacteria bacterium]MCF7855970.1 hypothetical protein [Candidatus Gracilibacteria bacterium]MCF7896337.1 hypothetical protein [Candidatus Gracilibacteria bacterium]